MSAVEQTPAARPHIDQSVEFLARERATLRAYAPDLADFLDTADLMEVEKPGGGEAIQAFARSDAPALLAPQDRDGLGATALDAALIQRAIGSRAPSLAVASTMHHFSMGSLVAWCMDGGDLQWMLLEGIARKRMVLASGFAEGKTGQSILTSTLTAVPNENGYLLNGAKKPCSLTWSMDMLTASVTIEHPDGTKENAMVGVPADAPGIEREPFWGSNILAGAESDAVILRDVQVPRQLVFPQTSDPHRRQERRGFLWFELLIAASYVGIASGLVERLLESPKGTPAVRTQAAIELETAMCALECVARLMEEEPPTDALLKRAMLARYGVQQAIARSATIALEALGGVAFISSPEIAYMHAACQALHFHPPSLGSTGEALAGALVGEETELA